MNFLLFLYLILHLSTSASSYSIPVPKIEILNPRGFRISIPHEPGIKLVGYHINIDKRIPLNSPGEFSAEYTQPTKGRWTYQNTRAVVDRGEVVNYWIHVQYGNRAYRRLGGGMATEHADNACELSSTTVRQTPVCKGELIFEDNFDNFDATKWEREIRIPTDLDDGEFVSFQGRPENCYVNDGQLHIIPNLLAEVPGCNETNILIGTLDLGARCTAVVDVLKECRRKAQSLEILPPVISARIRTKDFFSFRFGKVEARAKLPKGDWLFPMILLEPVENYYGYTGYASGQMRVAFSRGNQMLFNGANDISGNRIYGGVVLSNDEKLRDTWLRSSIRSSHSADDFHIYTLIWADDYISLQVDGNEYSLIRGNFSRLHKKHDLYYPARWDNGHLMAPFDREFYLTLGVSAGGHSDFPDGSLNGEERMVKPWMNRNSDAELRFWNRHENWFSSWHGDDAGLHVDYVKVYAL